MPNSRNNPLYPRFSLEEYEKNPVAVKRVNDAALEFLEALRDQIEKYDKLLKEKDQKIAEVQQIGMIDILQFLFLLLGSTMLAFGVNLATSSPHEWLGWVLSFVGCTIQFIGIIICFLAKIRR